MNNEYIIFPIVLYQDRYSRGWIAVANVDEEDRELLKLAEDYDNEKGGPFGDDSSNDYWHSNIPEWAFIADTPNEAYYGLLNKLKIS